jgi:D-arabinose 1-dehydrogenase-like Zn-dependent alcohol dehydrogenase
MYRDGKLQDIPIETRSLSAVNEAIDDLQAGRVTGRIVFVPDTPDAG